MVSFMPRVYLKTSLCSKQLRTRFIVPSPKIAGALALHSLFPPGSLDSFVPFSSYGQLFGFSGQSSYANSNAFLDTLATHRRSLGDNAVAFQWTSWRGLGMAASTDFINAELESKGITDVTRDEAFCAWEHNAKFDMDHAVVLRSLAFDENEPLRVPILNDIAVRRAGTAAILRLVIWSGGIWRSWAGEYLRWSYDVGSLGVGGLNSEVEDFSTMAFD